MSFELDRMTFKHLAQVMKAGTTTPIDLLTIYEVMEHYYEPGLDASSDPLESVDADEGAELMGQFMSLCKAKMETAARMMKTSMDMAPITKRPAEGRVETGPGEGSDG